MAADPVAIEVGARAAFIEWSRRPDAADRWDSGRVFPAVKEQFRAEARAALTALHRAGFTLQHAATAARRA